MKLNLYTIAALFITGIGTFLLGISLPRITRIMQRNYGSIMEDGLGFIALFGIGYIMAGIMMLMRLKSSTPFTTFILTTSMIGWGLFFFIEIYGDTGGEQMIVYSLSFFVLVFLFMLTLFVNNRKVVASIDDHEREEDVREDILDKL